jgi:hypothetical protein
MLRYSKKLLGEKKLKSKNLLKVREREKELKR